jgi:hypothetical protein
VVGELGNGFDDGRRARQQRLQRQMVAAEAMASTMADGSGGFDGGL